MVLNCIVSSAFQEHRDLRPLVSLLSVADEQNPLFFFAPDTFFDLGVQMVVPSLSALLPNPAWQAISNLSPFLRAFLLHKDQHQLVLFFAPRPFDQTRVEDFLPPMQTLNISPAFEGLSNFLPVPSPINFDCLCQLVIFLLRPMSFR